MLGESLLRVGIRFNSVSLPIFVVAMVLQHRWCKDFAKMWEGPFWEGVWPGPMGRGARTSSSCWDDPVKYGPHSELLFFLIRKEPVALTQAVPFEPFCLWETLKTCALTGLHLLAAEDEAGSSGSQSPETCGNTVAQKALPGTATLSDGRKAKALLHLSSANATWTALL